MNLVPAVTVVDFEVHLLTTMKLRIMMSHKESQLAAKLAEHRISIESAERIHKRVAEALGGDADYFGNLKNMLHTEKQGDTSLEFSSVLWPGFTFKAAGSQSGRLESARYHHANRRSADVESPVSLEIWSMDLTEFADRFGPMNAGRKWPFVDEHLSGYQEHEFEWGGENYGAGFSWGLFMFAAMSWD